MISIIIMSVLGNLLVRIFLSCLCPPIDPLILQVLISVLCNRALRQPPNLLLLSLAVTDMLVSLLVMPGALMQHTTGYWPGQDWLCLAWVFSDVFLCTSSILSLTAICIGESQSHQSHSAVTPQSPESLQSDTRVTPLILILIFTTLQCSAVPIMLKNMLFPNKPIVKLLHHLLLFET